MMTHEMGAEVANLYHLARAALRNPSDYERRIWAAEAFHAAHPEVSSTAAYKELCRQAAWRGGPR